LTNYAQIAAHQDIITLHKLVVHVQLVVKHAQDLHNIIVQAANRITIFQNNFPHV